MRIRTILAAAAAPAALAAILLGTAGQASAATGPSQFVTHINQHPDTTSLLPGYPVAGQDASLPYPGYGSVWAFDNVTAKLTPVPVQPTAANGYANWQVFYETTGSFHGFADPTTGAPLVSDGSVKGSVSYLVQAPAGVAPSGAYLPSQEPGGSVQNGVVINTFHLSGAAVQLWAPGTATVVGGGNDWYDNYQNGNYIQDPNTPITSWGDVTGH
jgi:hypothetical protein